MVLSNHETKGDNVELISKHADTCTIIACIVGSLLWMNGKFNDLDKDIGSLRTDVAIIKTVLVMKQIMPTELAVKSGEE